MISDVIVKAATKGKFLDFRNNLILANPEDYANIQGIGGKDHAPNSTIKAYLTEYAENGGGSKTVSFNCPTWLFSVISKVCLDNMGTVTAAPMSPIGRLFGAQQLMQIPVSTDFYKKLERVNTYKKSQDGRMVPVSVFEIYRNGYRGAGDVSRMPWTVKIQNFWAMPIQHPNGTTSYNSKQLVDKQEAYIMVSDDDMYRCAYRVNRFIELWENAYGINLIRNGISQRDAERIAFKQQHA